MPIAELIVVAGRAAIAGGVAVSIAVGRAVESESETNAAAAIIPAVPAPAIVVSSTVVTASAIAATGVATSIRATAGISASTT
jgi:hypothetical protein